MKMMMISLLMVTKMDKLTPNDYDTDDVNLDVVVIVDAICCCCCFCLWSL